MNINKKRVYGRRVKELRNLKGISKIVLGRLSYTNERTITAFENGHSLPQIDTCYHIMKALESSICYLVTGKNDVSVIGEISRDIVEKLGDLSLRDLEVVQKLVKYMSSNFDMAVESKYFYEWKLEQLMKENGG